MALVRSTIAASATISKCGRYRYDLLRDTFEYEGGGKGEGSCLWVMLNPSTADAELDDPTIKKVVGFTWRWGFRFAKVVNLFGLRATDPRELRALDALDPENIRHLILNAVGHDRVVLAWGGGLKHSKNAWIADYVTRIYSDAVCLDINGDGTPKHPLYIKYTTEPVSFTYVKGAGLIPTMV